MTQALPSMIYQYSRHCLPAALCLLLGACSTTPEIRTDFSNANAQDLLTVDCLLPPQVRQLGTHLTYIAQRRAIRTSGAQCALRGGEYVAYDRADFKSALAVWLPLAEQGDPEAQTYVGEIYEKGLGTRSSYELAARWYQRAVYQDYSRAKINLGYLYESGLGVERDLTKALNLYREASGFTAAELVFVSSIEVAKRKATRRENARLNMETQVLRSEIKAGRDQLRLQKAQLRLSENEVLKLRESMEDRNLPDYEQLLSEKETSLETLKIQNQQQTEHYAEQQADDARQVQQLKKTLHSLETELAAKASNIEMLQSSLVAKQARLQPDAVERTTITTIAGPSINIIDPPIVMTGGAPTLAQNSPYSADMIGKVEPVDSLFAFRINGIDHPVNPMGMFQFDTQSYKGENLELFAVDDKGESTRLKLSLNQAAEGASTSPKKQKRLTAQRLPLANIALGRYHALIIGNATYHSLKNLKTANNDAMAVEKVLRDNYGFNTELLLNANQTSILRSLERMRNTLTAQDNLVIYYAGHGELDSQSGRGYWLPVDADANNKSRWIANSAVTDIIDTMQAKHVLLIADSCYSGSLTRSSIARPLSGVSAALRLKWLKAVSQSRVRTVLSSGNNHPVQHSTGDSTHSIFATEFIDVLQRNTEVLETYELFFELQQRVAARTGQSDRQQLPHYAPIQYAGHQAGEFIFKPVEQTSVGASSGKVGAGGQ